MSDLLSNVWLELKGKNKKILVCTMYREFNDLTRKGQMSQNEQIERLHILHTQMEKASKEGPPAREDLLEQPLLTTQQWP